ncbi:hypothetical protein PGB90_003782 [Kerria lacca]
MNCPNFNGNFVNNFQTSFHNNGSFIPPCNTNTFMNVPPPGYNGMNIQSGNGPFTQIKADHMFFPIPNYSNNMNSKTTPFHCCDRDFFIKEKYKAHIKEHIICGKQGCTFTAHPKIVEKHISMQHRSGLFFRIVKGNSPGEIEKWISERKKRSNATCSSNQSKLTSGNHETALSEMENCVLRNLLSFRGTKFYGKIHSNSLDLIKYYDSAEEDEDDTFDEVPVTLSKDICKIEENDSNDSSPIECFSKISINSENFPVAPESLNCDTNEEFTYRC